MVNEAEYSPTTFYLSRLRKWKLLLLHSYECVLELAEETAMLIPFLKCWPYFVDVAVAEVWFCCCCCYFCLPSVVPSMSVIRFYRKGFDKRILRSEESGVAFKGYQSQWLSWIRPTLIPLGKIRLAMKCNFHHWFGGRWLVTSSWNVVFLVRLTFAWDSLVIPEELRLIWLS